MAIVHIFSALECLSLVARVLMGSFTKIFSFSTWLNGFGSQSMPFQEDRPHGEKIAMR